LAASIDTTAAAGDVISARLTTPILRPKSGKVLAPIGAKVTGRIVRMEHRFAPKTDFVVSMAFDAVEVDGVVFRLNARSDGNAGWRPSGQGHEDGPMGTFLFPGSNPRYLISAGYKSKWRTTAPASTK
jgi:hypothetical protein